MFWGDLKNTFTEKENSFKAVRLRVVPHLSSGDSRARARENHPHARKATRGGESVG